MSLYYQLCQHKAHFLVKQDKPSPITMRVHQQRRPCTTPLNFFLPLSFHTCRSHAEIDTQRQRRACGHASHSKAASREGGRWQIKISQPSFPTRRRSILNERKSVGHFYVCVTRSISDRGVWLCEPRLARAFGLLPSHHSPILQVFLLRYMQTTDCSSPFPTINTDGNQQ